MMAAAAAAAAAEADGVTTEERTRAVALRDAYRAGLGLEPGVGEMPDYLVRAWGEVDMCAGLEPGTHGALQDVAALIRDGDVDDGGGTDDKRMDAMWRQAGFVMAAASAASNRLRDALIQLAAMAIVWADAEEL